MHVGRRRRHALFPQLSAIPTDVAININTGTSIQVHPTVVPNHSRTSTTCTDSEPFVASPLLKWYCDLKTKIEFYSRSFWQLVISTGITLRENDAVPTSICGSLRFGCARLTKSQLQVTYTTREGVVTKEKLRFNFPLHLNFLLLYELGKQVLPNCCVNSISRWPLIYKALNLRNSIFSNEVLCQRRFDFASLLLLLLFPDWWWPCRYMKQPRNRKQI